MQKKLEAELIQLAHSILQMKNRDDLKALKKKANEVSEKLSVLSFIDDFVKETPQNIKTKEELIVDAFSNEPIIKEEKVDSIKVKDLNLEQEEEENILEPTASIDLFAAVQKETSEELQSSLEKEFEHTVSLDVATNMFENATRVDSKKSINDVVMQQKKLQIDLNDRIAFVKHLFGDSQEDFNRVISQLNTMISENEALSFLKMVKNEYNWTGKEIYEDRLVLLIERKFN